VKYKTGFIPSWYYLAPGTGTTRETEAGFWRHKILFAFWSWLLNLEAGFRGGFGGGFWRRVLEAGFGGGFWSQIHSSTSTFTMMEDVSTDDVSTDQK
jgi:hypothetical protein